MSHLLFSLEGKKALITGGGTGIGFGIAQAMVTSGAEVCIVGRREEVLLEACKKLGAQATYFVQDLSSIEALPNFAARVCKEWSIPEILVNNAGRNLKKWSFETSDLEFAEILNTNLHSVFSLSREFGKHMIELGGGSIILISSMAGIFGVDRVVAYATSKTAILGMMRSMTVEYASKGLRINAIAPGWIYSVMTDEALNADPERKAKVMGRIPADKMGNPQDIGMAAVYLASDASKYVNGVLLPVDGGAAIGF